MKVTQITAYLISDGTIIRNKTHAIKVDALLHGRSFPCPKCRTTGELQGNPIKERQRDNEAEGWAGSMGGTTIYKDVIVGYHQLECDVCQGYGYTEKEAKPITKEVVVGYE